MIQLCEPDQGMMKYVVEKMRGIDARELMETTFQDSVREMKDDLLRRVVNIQGLKYSVVVDGVPVCLGGVHPITGGVGQAWFFATPDIYKAPQSVTRQAKKVINYCLANFYRRIQADSAFFHEEAHRWLKVLGFSVESIKKQYGNSCDFKHFVVVNNG